LDEPTSGLDSYSARKVITSLRQLADRGHSIIYTLHQPNAEILGQFDKLMMIMESSNTIYYGPTSSASAYFEFIGLPVPRYCNPSEHYLKVVQLGGKRLDYGDGANLQDAVIDHRELMEAFKYSE